MSKEVRAKHKTRGCFLDRSHASFSGQHDEEIKIAQAERALMRSGETCAERRHISFFCNYLSVLGNQGLNCIIASEIGGGGEG